MDELELSLTKVEGPHKYRATLCHRPSNNQWQNDFTLELDRLTFTERLAKLDELALDITKDPDNLAVTFGKELFHTVLQGEVQYQFRRCTDNGPVRVRLRMEPEELKNLPWELMHNGEDFISAGNSILFSRIPWGIELKTWEKAIGPLRLLIVISNPLDLEPNHQLDIDSEMEALSYAFEPLEKENLLEVDCCHTASAEAVRDFLLDKDYHILHFTGHGCFVPDGQGKGRGFLLMEDSQGRKKLVDNEETARLLKEVPSLRLVTLSACQSVRTSQTEAFRDVARSLLKKGIPAVVAMRLSLLDSSATIFARAFYRAIARKKMLDEAMAEARNAMLLAIRSNGVDFSTPLLFLNDPKCLDLKEMAPGEKKEIRIEPVMFGGVGVMEKGFVGRHREVRLILDGFKSDRKRLAIIHGFGGIGKSVLSTTAALRMKKHFGLIKAVKLDAHSTAEGILGEINSVFMLAGIHEFNNYLNQALPLETKTDVLLQILRQVKLLLILDNCESVLDGERKIAKPDLAAFLNHLLNGLSSHSKVIITTRWEFDPLEGRLQDQVLRISLPEFNFFTARQLMNRHSQLQGLEIGEKLSIFRKIGGHPFAYEIFCRHLDKGTTVEKALSDLAPVEKELKAFTLLESAHEKFSPLSKDLLQRLSVLEEAFPMEAMQWMAEGKDIAGEAEEIMGWGLMSREKTEEGTRYSLYALVREACLERLRENPDLDRTRLLVRAGEYYVDLAKKSKNLWDLLLARDYFYQAGEFERAAEIVMEANNYLHRWGHLDRAMKLLKETADTTRGQIRAVALGNLATIYQKMGNYSTAMEKYEEVKKIFEEMGDKRNVATTLHQLGMVYQHQGDYPMAVEKYQQALEIMQELGNKDGIASTLHQLGNVHYFQGDYTAAVEKYRQSLEIKQELGDKAGIAQSLHQLGMVHQQQGDYTAAVEKYRQSLEISQELGDKTGIANTFGQLGNVHYSQGDYLAAVEKYRQSLEIAQELGDKAGIASTLHQLGSVHYLQGDYTAALEKLTPARDIFEQIGTKAELAITEKLIERIRSKMKQVH